MLLQAAFFIDNSGFDPSIGDLFYLLLKVFFILAGILYLIFAFVVTRQIHVMRSTVITPSSEIIRLLGLIHLVLAFGVLVFFIITL